MPGWTHWGSAAQLYQTTLESLRCCAAWTLAHTTPLAVVAGISPEPGLGEEVREGVDLDGEQGAGGLVRVGHDTGGGRRGNRAEVACQHTGPGLSEARGFHSALPQCDAAVFIRNARSAGRQGTHSYRPLQPRRAAHSPNEIKMMTALTHF